MEVRGLPEFIDRSKTLYQILGIDAQASETAIKQRYQKLSRVYHPDRHAQSEALREAAHDKFPSIEYAKHVLMDPFLRGVYDEHGYNGLALVEESGRDAEALALLARLKESPFQPILGHIHVPFDLARQPIHEQLLLTHGIQHIFYNRLILRATARVLCRRQRPETVMFDGVLAYYDHHGSCFRLGGLLGVAQNLSVSYESRINNTSSTAKIGCEYSPQKGANVQLECNVPLTESWSANMYIDSNDMDFEPKLSYHPPRSRFSGSLSLAGLEWKCKRLTQAGFLRHLGVAGELGVDHVSVGLSRKWKKDKRLLCSLEWRSKWMWGLRHAYHYDISANWKGFQFTVPVGLPFLDPVTGGLTLLAPQVIFLMSSIAYDGLQQFVWAPRQAQASTVAQKEKILAAAEEARRAMDALRPQVEHIIQAERERGGLIIVEAWYGRLDAQVHDADLPPMIDVTLALQALVTHTEGRSELRVGLRESKSVLDGFYDPCPGQPKQLWVRYQFRGTSNHTLLVDDAQPFSAPRSRHLQGPPRPF